MTDAQPIPTRDDFRTLVMDAIAGVGVPTAAVGIAAEKAGLAVFYSPRQSWVWVREKLAALSTEALQELYVSLKVAQDGGE